MFRFLLLSCLGAFGAVLRATLTTTVHACRVERAAHEVIAHTREVLHTTAANEHDRVLLQIVALARDVGVDLFAVCQSDTCHLTHCRVRLLRGRGVHTGTNASTLGTRRECGRLTLVLQAYSTVSY